MWQPPGWGRVVATFIRRHAVVPRGSACGALKDRARETRDGGESPHDWHSICAKLAAPLDRTCCTAGLGRPSGEAADRSGAVSRVIRNGQARSIVRPWNFPTIDCPDAESLQLNIGVHDVPSVLTAAGLALV
jgi:hypothetical protein